MRMVGMLVLATLSSACQAGSGSDDADEQTPLPSPYADSGDETGPEVPAMQPESMVAAAVAGLSAFESLEPDAVVDAWESMLVFEADCPEQQLSTMEGGLTVIDWGSEGCTTSAGLTIRGAGHLERTASDEGGRATEGAVLYSEGGTMRLSTADGRFLEMNGYLGWERGTSPEGTDAYFEVSGELAADSATAAGSSLLDPEVRAQGFLFSFAGEGYQALGGSGSVSGPALGEALAFQFTDLLLVPQACATEPAATLSIRDDAGYWHDIVFDAATLVDGEEPVFEPDRCDGCGTYVVAGAVLGDACISPAQVGSLMDWEDYPW